MTGRRGDGATGRRGDGATGRAPVYLNTPGPIVCVCVFTSAHSAKRSRPAAATSSPLRNVTSEPSGLYVGDACPGRKPPNRPAKRPARPYKSATHEADQYDGERLGRLTDCPRGAPDGDAAPARGQESAALQRGDLPRARGSPRTGVFR